MLYRNLTHPYKISHLDISVMGWFPNHKGKSVGVTVGGFGLGALVFNYITTAVINPNNVSPIRLTPNR